MCDSKSVAKRGADDIEGVSVEPLNVHRDKRGWLLELWREDEGSVPAMGYVSLTNPSEARGPHEHREQTDVFVFAGPGFFRLRLWDARPGSWTKGHVMTRYVGSDHPVKVVVPPGVVHGYMNVGGVPGIVLNHPDRLYAGQGRTGPVDEIRHEDGDSPFRLDEP